MKKYIGTKQVEAEPMTMGEAYERGLLQVGRVPDVESANEKVLYRSIQEILIEATEGSKKDLWHTSDKIPKKNRPLLLQLSNGMLVFGKFEGWGYSFSIPEPLYKIERDLYT